MDHLRERAADEHAEPSEVGIASAAGHIAVYATPAHPRKDGTSHQICSNGRFSCDLV
ncbi:hypothetical protein ACQX0P_09540 [Corynebacterium diphtheriae]